MSIPWGGESIMKVIPFVSTLLGAVAMLTVTVTAAPIITPSKGLMSVAPWATQVVCKNKKNSMSGCKRWCDNYDRENGQSPGTCAAANCSSCSG